MNPVAPRQVLIWDAPVRVFHWLMVSCFAGAWLTAESEHWRLLHVTLGYTMAGLVGFRLVWGFVGTRYALFSDFVRGPAAVLGYLGKVLRLQPNPHTGHNPAGAVAIVALLGLTLVIAGTGWAIFNEIGPEVLEQVHDIAADTMLAVIAVHFTGVLVSSKVNHENLIRSMITGCKPVKPEEGIGRAWRVLAVLMLLTVLGYWWLQWHNAP